MFSQIAKTSVLFLTLNCAVFAAPALDQYEIVFNDEFNGQTLDPSKWSTTHLWGPFRDINGEKQYYVDSLDLDAGASFNPFEFTGSTLKIRAIETDANNQAPEMPESSDPVWTSHPEFHIYEDYDASSREYLSGIISSVNDYTITHGYFETRAKLPKGQGLWSAFWLLNTKYVEDTPEIDIMEALGHETNIVNHTLHYVDSSSGVWVPVSSPTYRTEGPDFSEGFHTFGVAWDPRKITWYVDGEVVRTLTDDDYEIAKQSMYIIANLAVGGTWPGDPDSTTVFPAEYEIDYIRAYKRKPVTQINDQVLASEFQLMFSDEFDGQTLDPLKWNTSYLWGPFLQINAEEQYYVDKHARDAQSSINPFDVSNGTLKITAAPLSENDVPVQPPESDGSWQDYPTHQFNEDYGTTPETTPKYSSGVATTYDSFKFIHGYVEARIKMVEGAGLWPAFWLLNGYYVGPMPEIDIVELQGEAPEVAHHSYHYHNEVGVLQSSAELSYASNGNFADDFHTYGVYWTHDTITWYVDGSPVRILTGDEVSQQLMYIILNLAVGGNFVGEVDPSATPATLEIDYVRAWQRKDVPYTCNGLEATIVGTNNDDTINGTPQDDVIVALGGDDIINGLAGSDTICGGDGDDTIDGGTQNDWINGEQGVDWVKGGPDNDVLFGGYGEDTLLGSRGNDQLDGGGSNDTLYGGVGDDTMKGGPGDDHLYGGFDNDIMRGSKGDDWLHGEEGIDYLNGGLGNDYLKGGPDNDELIGSVGNDTLRGSKGDDILNGGAGDDVLNGGVHDNHDTCDVDANDTVAAQHCEI